MTSAAYSAHPALAIAAEAVLPTLGVLAVIAIAVETRAGRLKKPAVFSICALVSFALVYLVRYASHASWRWLALDRPHFSTHTAVAITLAVTLTACRTALLLPAVLVVGAYLWLITYLPYHSPDDVLSTLAIMLPLSVLCHLPCWKAGR